MKHLLLISLWLVIYTCVTSAVAWALEIKSKTVAAEVSVHLEHFFYTLWYSTWTFLPQQGLLPTGKASHSRIVLPYLLSLLHSSMVLLQMVSPVVWVKVVVFRRSSMLSHKLFLQRWATAAILLQWQGGRTVEWWNCQNDKGSHSHSIEADCCPNWDLNLQPNTIVQCFNHSSMPPILYHLVFKTLSYILKSKPPVQYCISFGLHKSFELLPKLGFKPAT